MIMYAESSLVETSDNSVTSYKNWHYLGKHDILEL